MSILYRYGPVFLVFPLFLLPPLRRHVDRKKESSPSSWHRPTVEFRYHHTFFSYTLAGMDGRKPKITIPTSPKVPLFQNEAINGLPEDKSATLASLQPPDNPCNPFFSVQDIPSTQTVPNITTLACTPILQIPCSWRHVAKSQPRKPHKACPVLTTFAWIPPIP